MDYTRRLTHPYLVGTYLAINAIQDAYLLVDGPGCAFTKASRIHGKHDWYSTLLSCSGNHRVQFTGITVHSVTLGAEDTFREKLKEITVRPDAGAFFSVAFPFCSIVGTQYDMLLREHAKVEPRPMFNVPGKSLEGDWVSGYTAVLDAMAQGMPIPERSSGADTDVAVIGYMMERTEGDDEGNVQELRRILREIGLNPVSIWLSGDPFERAAAAVSARTIISLPYGSGAAARLAQRTGARLIETGYPLGLKGTQEWIRRIAGALNISDRAERFIDRELSFIIPRLEWLIPTIFLNRKFVFVGDYHRYLGFAGLVEELGGRIAAAFITSRSGIDSQRSAPPEDGKVFVEPRETELMKKWKEVENEADLLVADTFSLEILRPKMPWVEFGFPSYFTHYIKQEPYLGFQGVLSLVQRMSNALNSRFVISDPGMRS